MPKPPPDHRLFLGHSGPIAIAHRAGNDRHPENTHAAFQSAYERGYRFIETDVHSTFDGVVLAFHDTHLDRMTGRRGRLDALTWDEIRHLPVHGGEPIPRLSDLLVRWPDVRFNIDPKSDAVLAPLISLIDEHDARDRVCVGSFSHSRLDRARQHRVTTSASPREVFSIRLGSLGWPNRLRPRVRAHCLQVPTHHHGVPVIDRRFVRFAHRVGMPVHVWTINSRDEMHRLLDVDVDGLMTDDLDVLAAVFAERGLPLSGIPAQLGSGGAVAAPKGSHR